MAAPPPDLYVPLSARAGRRGAVPGHHQDQHRTTQAKTTGPRTQWPTGTEEAPAPRLPTAKARVTPAWLDGAVVQWSSAINGVLAPATLPNPERTRTPGKCTISEAAR